jgi:tetratricopeptide (TPR) repeat protein
VAAVAPWEDLPVYGGSLPPDVECLLRQAAARYHDEAAAERLLHEALDLAPAHVAVQIALYRFYFYKNRLGEALRCAVRCLDQAAGTCGLARDWRRVRPGEAAFDSYDAMPRFYLFTLKAYAYIQMRLGCLEEGREAVAKVLELDPGDKLGASVLQGVLDRVGMEEDDE